MSAVLVMLSPYAFVHAEQETDVAKQLANPVASLISLPFQLNYDENFGSDDRGSLLRLNIQPVIPVSLGDHWNLISRTILPIVNQQDFPFAGYSEFGLSDTAQSFFFSAQSADRGWLDLGRWSGHPVAHCY